MKRFGFIGAHRGDKREKIGYHGWRHVNACIKPGILKVLPEEDQLGYFGMPAEPDIIAEMLDHLFISCQGSGKNSCASAGNFGNF